MKILVVEDDQAVARTLEFLLSSYNYAVDVAADGELGLQMVEAFNYDLLVLDVLLPKLDGIGLCQQLRAQGFQSPILLLTGQGENRQKAIALNAGADDYVVKPFDAEELVARVQALLRRGNHTSQPILAWGQLSIDPSLRKVTYGNQLLTLTPKEYAILELFLRRPRSVLSLSTILDHVWTSIESPGDAAIRVHIKELRQKLGVAGAPRDLIKTKHRIGYQLNPLYGTASMPQTADQSLRSQLAELNEVNAELQQQQQELELAYQSVEQNYQQLQTIHDELEHQLAETTNQLSQANLRLQQQQQLYQTLLQNLPDIVERFDLQLRHLYASPALERVTGIAANRFLGKTCRELGLPSEMVDRWEAAAQALLATGQSQTIEFEVQLLNGLRYFEMRLVPELTTAKAIAAILCISRDVTAFKRLKVT